MREKGFKESVRKREVRKMRAEGICVLHGRVCLEQQLEVERGLGSLQKCQLVHLLQIRTG